MSDDLESLDGALSAAFGKRRPSTTDKIARRAREKSYALNPEDGRRKRATGRTKAFNVKMKPELHSRIVKASRQHDVSITVMCEQAFEMILTKLDENAP
jgi:predicted HicB family RNase H-like nuclease